MNNSRRAIALLFASLLVLGVTAKTEHLESIFLRLYVGNNVYVDEYLKNATLLLAKMESNKPTVLYVHGFTESADSNSVSTVVDAYLQRNDHNILVADYRKIANESYVKVVKSAGDVGTALADALNDLVVEGLDPERIHIVGHSLGAQVAGHIAGHAAFKIPRITGLDPAGPFFNLLEVHLNAEDAGLVDIIHTDYGIYGTARTTGTVDFFPNGGRRVQPGCPQNPPLYSDADFCSHHRSWQFYAESLVNEKAFLGVMCQNLFHFVFGECDRDNIIPMGYATPTNAKGTYYLVTNKDSPYGLGDRGTSFHGNEAMLNVVIPS